MLKNIAKDMLKKNGIVGYNLVLTEYGGDNDILSIDSYIHGQKNKIVYDAFQSIFFKLNKYLRSNEFDTSFEKFDEVITSKVDFDFIVYRGIPEDISCEVGDILTNLGYLFTTLNFGNSTRYLCYKHDDCYIYKDSILTISKFNINKHKRYNGIGTRFKIHVNKGTSFFNYTYLTSFLFTDCEIIFNKNHKLKVIAKSDIQTGMYGEEYLFREIECELI